MANSMVRKMRSSLKKTKFLEAFAECGNITHSAKVAGVSRDTHYHKWLGVDKSYTEAFKQAREKAIDALEEEALRRAKEGWVEPVWHLGQQVGVVRKFSDTLLIFLLKGLRPGVYREHLAVEHSGTIDHRV